MFRGRPIHKLESEQEVVGLGRIETEDTWVVPVGEGRVVYVEFNLDARQELSGSLEAFTMRQSMALCDVAPRS